ncbi:MAG: chemotaxis response regulator protein-glutamate methylesterase [Deltaproteobacteria bacterium]|nr:MAG: chemotaxis response regulator protein-glutamate methylesterase [Deltaproteobacteria bacterium]
MSGWKSKQGKVRVLIADDSELARVVLHRLLSSDPEIEVVGMATRGDEVADMVERLAPDIVTMDLRMPGLDGLAATAEIMKRCPTPVIIVTSSGIVGRKDDVFASFKYGVVDVIQKPDAVGSSPAALTLIEKVKILSRVRVSGDVWSPGLRSKSLRPLVKPVWRDTRAIGVGASTGGPRALHRVLTGLPADLPMPVFVVQHMSEGFVPGFAEWLGVDLALDLRIAQDGDRPRPGQVLLAPGGANMLVDERFIVRLNKDPPETGILPSVDVLLLSLARTYGADALGVVLTGIGKDGAQGMAAMKAAGGVTLVQDERSCVVFGMPNAAIAVGAVDEVLSLDLIADRLLTLTGYEPKAEADRSAGSEPGVEPSGS